MENKDHIFIVPQKWFLILVAITFAGYAGLVGVDWRYGTLRDAYTPWSIGCYLAAFLAYIALLFWVERWGISRRWLWGGAILFRLMLLQTSPTLSDDVYRMLWDGHVANNGVSPYAYAIDSPVLDYLAIPVRDLANNTWMASPYLPAAQVVFWGITAVFPLQPLFMQAAMVIFDLLCGVVIARLLVLALLPGRRLMIYLWNPLVIVEVAHGAHIDAWMVFLALLAVYLALRSLNDDKDGLKGSFLASVAGKLLSPLFLALGTLTKLLPVLLLPVLFWLWNWPQRIFYGLAAFLLLLPSGLQAGWGLGSELDGTGLFGALRIYVEQWKFNSGLFHWLAEWLGSLGVADPLEMGQRIVFVLLLGLLTAVWLAARKHTQPRPALRLMSVPLMGYSLLTPTFHPWYLLILLAFIPFWAPAKDERTALWLWVAPWLYLSGALVFSYLTYLNPLAFGELEWVRKVEWLPVVGMMGVAAVVVYLWRGKEENY